MERIILTEEGARVFLEAIENPPEPNEHLKKLAGEAHKDERRFRKSQERVRFLPLAQ